MLNYILFQNPKDTYSGLPHASCMIYKPGQQLIDYNLSNADVKDKPFLNTELLGRIIKAKLDKLNYSIQYAYWMHSKIYGVKRNFEEFRINKTHYEKVILAKKIKTQNKFS